MKFPLEHYPGMNRFVLDWMGGDGRFLPRSVAGCRLPVASQKPATGNGQLATALVDTNRQWGLDVGDEIRRWAAGGTYTVVAGQQVGFAGGPLYTLVKLASVIKIKRENEKRGVPTTAFFWLPTEDHDFDEVSRIAIPRRQSKGQLDLITLRAGHALESRQVVGQQIVPESLIVELLALLDMERPSWLRPKITFRDSFAELLATLAGNEVILIDALLPELRREGAPLFDKMITNWNAIQRELEQRAAALRAAGYTPQVLPREDGGYTLLYELDDHGNRELVDSPRPLAAPERVSTSALTRPLLQDLVLQPDLFIGGPAEVAYYAQIAPLHELLGVPMPRVGLRAHALVAPRRALKALAKYQIAPQEIFAGADALLAAREPAGVAEIKAAASRAHEPDRGADAHRRDRAARRPRAGQRHQPLGRQHRVSLRQARRALHPRSGSQGPRALERRARAGVDPQSRRPRAGPRGRLDCLLVRVPRRSRRAFDRGGGAGCRGLHSRRDVICSSSPRTRTTPSCRAAAPSSRRSRTVCASA